MKRIALALTIASVLAAGWVSTAKADQPKGPVVIYTNIDFSNWPTLVGEFEVLEGAEILGFTSGTVIDSSPAKGEPPGGHSAIVRSDCYVGREPDENGPDFTVIVNPNPTVPGPGDSNGQWVFWKGTGEYENLRGGGEINLFFDFPNAQLHIFWTGTAHREP